MDLCNVLYPARRDVIVDPQRSLCIGEPGSVDLVGALNFLSTERDKIVVVVVVSFCLGEEYFASGFFNNEV